MLLVDSDVYIKQNMYNCYLPQIKSDIIEHSYKSGVYNAENY